MNSVKSDENVRISAPFRQPLSFSFYSRFGSNWPAKLGIGSSNVFVADFASTLVAPYTGMFFFAYLLRFLF
jgi:hypothetical protein